MASRETFSRSEEVISKHRKEGREVETCTEKSYSSFSLSKIYFVLCEGKNYINIH